MSLKIHSADTLTLLMAPFQKDFATADDEGTQHHHINIMGLHLCPRIYYQLII